MTFTGSDSLQNVISRVSGNNSSIIDGILKSDIKNADFYFINPNGITFNANAQVDVPAAFHVSTADKMDFGKNGNPAVSFFLCRKPVGFISQGMNGF